MVHFSGKIVIRLVVLVAALSGGLEPGALLCDEPYLSVDRLREIEAEGRQIALYFAALAAAQDEFARKAPTGAVSDRQVIVARRNGWHVLFVTDPDPRKIREKPKLIAEVVIDPKTAHIRKFRYVEDPRSVPGIAWEHLLAVESAQLAGAAAEEATSPCDAAIFFEQGVTFRIYLTPTPADGMIRFGGDLLVTVERNPVSVSSIESLHAATWPVALPAVATNEPTAHSHLENDLPTATDVALVMAWPTLAPHLVLTPRFLFRIDADGTIGYLGPSKPLDAASGGEE
jgi:hypothetical protein